MRSFQPFKLVSNLPNRHIQAFSILNNNQVAKPKCSFLTNFPIFSFRSSTCKHLPNKNYTLIITNLLACVTYRLKANSHGLSIRNGTIVPPLFHSCIISFI